MLYRSIFLRRFFYETNRNKKRKTRRQKRSGGYTALPKSLGISPAQSTIDRLGGRNSPFAVRHGNRVFYPQSIRLDPRAWAACLGTHRHRMRLCHCEASRSCGSFMWTIQRNAVHAVDAARLPLLQIARYGIRGMAFHDFARGICSLRDRRRIPGRKTTQKAEKKALSVLKRPTEMSVFFLFINRSQVIHIL